MSKSFNTDRLQYLFGKVSSPESIVQVNGRGPIKFIIKDDMVSL